MRRLLLWGALPFLVFAAIGLYFQQQIISFLTAAFLDACGGSLIWLSPQEYFWAIIRVGLWFGLVCTIPLLTACLVHRIALRARGHSLALTALFAGIAGLGIAYGYTVPVFFPHGWCGSDLAAANIDLAAKTYLSFAQKQLLIYEVSFLAPIAALVAWWFSRPTESGQS